MATESVTEGAPDAFEDLAEHYRRITGLEDAAGVLRWDQQVTMPEGGTPARSLELSTLSGLQHELLTEEDVGDWLHELADADLDPPEAAVVREIRREYDRATQVPRRLVEAISTKTSDALPVWEQAKADDDWDAFAPHVEELIGLKREYAEHIDPDRDPYAVLFDDYEPYLDLDTAERVLGRLRDALVPLIDEVSAADVEIENPFSGGTYPADDQEALSRSLLSSLGFDWERGRLDTSSHPFTSGNQFDSRITTRFDESEPISALLSTIHEFGHATYALGLPQDQYGSPLGDDRDLTVHESQSRLWENHVGRSRAFWELVAPEVRSQFDAAPTASAEDLYRATNRIYPDNLIRVEADELTYHLHIVLRFELERDLIAGDLDVAEVPAVWNEKMEEYLGVRPETDTEGCLQDIHWSHGSFGYFPTYSLGSVLAAQLYHHAAADLDDLEGQIRAGEFDALHEWLTRHVHRHGRQYTTPDLIVEATGEAYTADYFIEYAEEKFGALYGL